VLEPVSVRNPYAEQLILPDSVFKPRRTNAHYLQFIEVITFYHQFQREQKCDESTGKIFIETTIEDIQEANHLMKEILLRKSDDLTGGCRNYFELINLYLQKNELTTFTNRIISKALHIPLSTIKRHNFALLNAGYIYRTDEKIAKSFTYGITSGEDYQKLQNSITAILDNVLVALQSNHQLNGSLTAHHLGEPVKLKPGKKKRLLAQ